MKDTMKLPAECAVLSEEEMTYTEGGKAVDFLGINFNSRLEAIVCIGLGAIGVIAGVSVLAGLWAAYVQPSLAQSGIKMPWDTSAKANEPATV